MVATLAAAEAEGVVATAGGRGGGCPFSSSFSVFFFALLFFSVSAIFLLFSARRYWWLWRGRATMALSGWRWPAVVLLLPPFYSSFGFLSLGSVLFLFSLSGSASVGSADGGGMTVLDGGGRRPRWRERSSCWEPEMDDFFLTLDLLRSLFFSPFSSLLTGLCFLFLSPFSRLASLSVTALLSFSKILPPLFHSPPPSIYKQEEKVPPCSVPLWCRGETSCLTSAG